MITGTLSFEERRIVVDEAAGHVEVCVRSSGTVQNFQVHSIDASAKG